MQNTLFYFVDPVCSRCWAYSDRIKRIYEEFRGSVEFRVILGNIHPLYGLLLEDDVIGGAGMGVLQDANNGSEAFNFSLFNSNHYAGHSEPVYRAIVTAINLNLEKSLAFLLKLQALFFEHVIDIYLEDVLFDTAESLGYNRREFALMYWSKEIDRGLIEHYQIAKVAGVKSLPELHAVDEHGVREIYIGYGREDRVIAAIEKWLKDLGRLAAQGTLGS